MGGLVVPQYNATNSGDFPSLGPQVCDWIEANLVFGPGDLLGEPAVVDEDKRGILTALYEVHPPWSPEACRRRFRRGAVSLRKGLAKTELGAWIAAAELDAEAPVRCDGWDAYGQPVGIGIMDPYIPLVASTEDQSEELAYGALMAILERSQIADRYDIGLARIMRANGRGRCEAVAAVPDARDGARTTFQLFDETHRMVLNRIKKAHQVMLASIPKRKIADAWSLEITTAPQLGEGSVAEDTWKYAEEIAKGLHKNSSLFFFHREADEGYNLEDEKSTRKAVIQATGTAALKWSSIEGVMDLWRDPQTDRAYFERVWLNRKVKSSSQVFNMALAKECVETRTTEIFNKETQQNEIVPQRLPPRGTKITLGFDGSKTNDATGIVGTEIETGYQFLIAFWERPEMSKEEEDAQRAAGLDWEVPVNQVEQMMENAHDQWKVEKSYCDPFYWDTQVNTWYGKWPKAVVRYMTNQHKKMAFTLKAYLDAWRAKEVKWDGSDVMYRHMANARKMMLNYFDERGEQMFVMRKESHNSPLKIDVAMAACLSWAARNDAIANGALKMNGSRAGRSTVYIG